MRPGKVALYPRRHLGHGVGIGFAGCGCGACGVIKPREFHDGLGEIAIDGGLISGSLPGKFQFHGFQQGADMPQRQGVQVQHAVECPRMPCVLHKQGLVPGQGPHIPSDAVQKTGGKLDVQHRQFVGVRKGVHRSAMKHIRIAGGTVAMDAVDRVPGGSIDDDCQFDEVVPVFMEPAFHQRRSDAKWKLWVVVEPVLVALHDGTIVLHFGTKIKVIVLI